MNQLHFNIKFTCHYRLFVSINIKWRRQKFINKNRFFSFVNNSCSYWQKSTKFHAEVHYTDLHNILKIFKVLLTSTIFPPTVPFDPVSHFTPVSPIGHRINISCNKKFVKLVKQFISSFQIHWSCVLTSWKIFYHLLFLILFLHECLNRSIDF
jgi:hypothetical protein